MKMNGGVAKADLGTENVDAVKEGCANLGRHIENMKKFGVPAVVGINHFRHRHRCRGAGGQGLLRRRMGVEAILNKHWELGSEGITEARQKVVEICRCGSANYAPLYPDEMPLFEKIETICKEIYRADEVVMDRRSSTS